jgi:hypothetical protein
MMPEVISVLLFDRADCILTKQRRKFQRPITNTAQRSEWENDTIEAAQIDAVCAP